jgi:hypothetical protein
MKPIKIPDWWDSIRAILSLVLSISYCWGILVEKLPKEQLEGLYRLAEMAIIFYFAFKKRPEENGGVK